MKTRVAAFGAWLADCEGVNLAALMPIGSLPLTDSAQLITTDLESGEDGLPVVIPFRVPFFPFLELSQGTDLAGVDVPGAAPASPEEAAGPVPATSSPQLLDLVEEKNVRTDPGEAACAGPARAFSTIVGQTVPSAMGQGPALPPGLEILTSGREKMIERFSGQLTPLSFAARITPATPGPPVPPPWMLALAGQPPEEPAGAEAPAQPGSAAEHDCSPEPQQALETVSEQTQPARRPESAPPPGVPQADDRAREEASAGRTTIPPVGADVQRPGMDKLPLAAHRPLPQPALQTREAAGDVPNELRPRAAREIQLRVPAREESPVDVRLVERAGHLHVSVRTREAGLSSVLREHLSELVTRLEGQGFRTQTWTPEAARLAVAEPAGDNLAGSPDPHGDTGSGRHMGSGGSPDGRERQQEDKPRWLAGFEDEMRASEEELP